MPKQTCECGATYRFADSSIGKRAKCTKCGAIITLQGDDEGVIAIADEGEEYPGATDSNGHAGTASNVDEEEYRRAIGAGRSAAATVEEEAAQSRGYFADCLALFAFPKEPGNLVTFVFLWGMLCVNALVLRELTPFGWVLQALIFGWYSAFRFSLIRESTAGVNDLPSLTMREGFWGDLFTPFFKWAGCWIIVLLPAVLGLKAVVGAGASGMAVLDRILNGGIGGVVQLGLVAEALLFLSLLGMGLFMWPIIILCVAVDGFGSLARVDLLFITVAKTLPVYVLTVLVVYGADFAESYMAASGQGVLWGALTVAVGLYLEIVALRMIGLYYFHFKSRFAWSWG